MIGQALRYFGRTRAINEVLLNYCFNNFYELQSLCSGLERVQKKVYPSTNLPYNSKMIEGISGSSTSTTQFISSWRDRSAISSVWQKKEFIAINYEQLKTDSSRAAGEYINSYAELSGCGTPYFSVLGLELQRNFQIIFPRVNKNSEKTYEAIKGLIKNNLKLRENCGVKV